MVSLCPTAAVSWSKIPSRATGHGQGPFHALTAFVCLGLSTFLVAQILSSFWIHPTGQRSSLGDRVGHCRAGLSNSPDWLEWKSLWGRGGAGPGSRTRELGQPGDAVLAL